MTETAERPKRVSAPPGWAECFARDVAIYQTESERAAYRAGMSTAAAICDHLATELGRDNQSRGRLNQIGEAIVSAARTCGDRIWDWRAKIKVG